MENRRLCSCVYLLITVQTWSDNLIPLSLRPTTIWLFSALYLLIICFTSEHIHRHYREKSNRKKSCNQSWKTDVIRTDSDKSRDDVMSWRCIGLSRTWQSCSSFTREWLRTFYLILVPSKKQMPDSARTSGARHALNFIPSLIKTLQNWLMWLSNVTFAAVAVIAFCCHQRNWQMPKVSSCTVTGSGHWCHCAYGQQWSPTFINVGHCKKSLELLFLYLLFCSIITPTSWYWADVTGSVCFHSASLEKAQFQIFLLLPFLDKYFKPDCAAPSNQLGFIKMFSCERRNCHWPPLQNYDPLNYFSTVCD